jgi:carotenoid cleavage dioxygenase
MPFQWSDAHKARIGVVPRGGGAARWFEVAPSHLGHTVNAFEQGGRIVMEGVRYAHRPEARYAQFSGAPPLYHRWELELASGRVHEQPLDDQPVELPRVDERRVGRPHRYAYAVELQALVDAAIAGSRLRRYDTTTGESVVHDFGPLQVPGECVFVPAGADAAEDSGWLLSFVYDGERDRSDLVVLDARAFAAPPVARIRLPGRVPFGFHGSWVPAGRP